MSRTYSSHRPSPARETFQVASGRLSSSQPLAGEVASRPSSVSHRFGGYALGQAPPSSQSPVQRQSDGPLAVKNSTIHGKGLFARQGFNAGSDIALAAESGVGGDWELTREARFTNHQKEANAEATRGARGDQLMLKASRPIGPDEEVTVNYNAVGRATTGSSLSWRGEKVPPGGGAARTFFRHKG